MSGALHAYLIVCVCVSVDSCGSCMHHQAVVLHYVGQTACREKDRDLFAELNCINTVTVLY